MITVERSYSEYADIIVEQHTLNGKLHRTDGPALVITDVETEKIQHTSWYLYGKQISPKEWLLDNRYKWPLTNQQETEFLLTFA